VAPREKKVLWWVGGTLAVIVLPLAYLSLRKPRSFLLGRGAGLRPWYYDYGEGHFHRIAKVTPGYVHYDVVDDGIVITRRKKPRTKVDRSIRQGEWIPVTG
jgi:hypothetical protein